jgi:hypothetical protein
MLYLSPFDPVFGSNRPVASAPVDDHRRQTHGLINDHILINLVQNFFTSRRLS